MLRSFDRCKKITPIISFSNFILQKSYYCNSNNNVIEEKKDFSKSLLLPKTSFPMRANAAQIEPKYRKRCTSELYKWQLERYNKDPEKYPLWVTHDGPPYANGSPHIGHSLNKILKDIVNRYKLLRGHSISYIPGWDCHGLPIELKTIQENDLKTHRYDNKHDVIKLRKLAKKVASSAIKLQKKHFMEWGVMGEWENPYLTLLPSYESSQISVFYDLYKNGYIYQGVRPVHWSPSSNTALAEAELEYPEKYTSTSVFCTFPIIESSIPIDFKNILTKNNININNSNINLLIWTTTPWTLPSNMGVCINSNIDYCLVSISKLDNKENNPDNSNNNNENNDINDNNYYIIAKSRLEYLSSTFNKNINIIEEYINPDSLLNIEYNGLLRNGKIYEADFVTDSSGTGLVHTAPGHGHDDFKILTGKYNVEPFCPVDNFGKYTNEVGKELEGLEVLTEGNKKIIEILKERNMLIHKHSYEHKYPHDWRTKKPIIIRTTKQWFTDLRSLIPKTIKQLDNVEMIPISGKERFSNLLKQRDDWCISRQRCWGVPIPVFIHKETSEPLINEDTINHIKSIVNKNGVDSWWSYSVEELLPDKYKHMANEYEICFDTVDVWFDSGVSWNSVIKNRNLPIADLYLEGTDQYRGWFQSSLLTSTGVTNSAPYKRIITHGFVLDGEGRKMSKSIGNVIDPAIILRGGDDSPIPYGSDVLRMWVGSVDYTKDVSISYNYVQTLSESKRKIRNTVRFMLSNINDLKEPIEYKYLYNIDKYMLYELYCFSNQITKYYDEFNYQKSFNLIHQMCINDWSSFYFESIKDRLYADDQNSLSRKSTQTVLAYSLTMLTKSLSPILCHMTEEIFENIPKSLRNILFNINNDNDTDTDPIFSIFQTGWFNLKSEWNSNPTIADHWNKIKKLKDSVNFNLEQLRRKKTIKTGLEATVTILLPNTDEYKFLESIECLHLIFNVSSVTLEYVNNDNIEFLVLKSEQRKCDRCWLHKVEESSTISLCNRCKDVMKVDKQ